MSLNKSVMVVNLLLLLDNITYPILAIYIHTHELLQRLLDLITIEISFWQSLSGKIEFSPLNNPSKELSKQLVGVSFLKLQNESG